MPSDDRIGIALEAVAASLQRFRTAVNTAGSVSRAILAAGTGAERARAELGPYAADRIDASRFAELSAGTAIDLDARGSIEDAVEILDEIAALADSAFVIHAAPGESVTTRVRGVLRRCGRAFAAARAVDEARRGRGAKAIETLARPYPFEQWTSLERLVAPAVVIVVAGTEMRVAELSGYLDGGLHICLVVKGSCPSAPLARSITPGTLVLQTAGTRGLDRFASYQGPAIAALVPESAAAFIHDPARGAMPWQRIELWHRPTESPRSRIGAATTRQQREDLDQLLALATVPAMPTGASGTPAAADDVADRLSAWLLSESGLGGAR